MDPLITIASLSIKAINTYFNSKEEQLLQQISKQNEDLIALSIYQYNQSKTSVLEKAAQELQDGLICSDSLLRRNTLLSAYQDYTSLSILPLTEQLPNGTYINNEDYISKGYWGRFMYFGFVEEFRNSAIQVYECALRLPHHTVRLFDSSFFPQIDCSQLSELCENLNRIDHYKSPIGLYSNIPDNMAKALIVMQLKKYEEKFTQILNLLKTEQYEQV